MLWVQIGSRCDCVHQILSLKGSENICTAHPGPQHGRAYHITRAFTPGATEGPGPDFALQATHGSGA
eukprot:3530711-Karenia_brevis.AAC.1